MESLRINYKIVSNGEVVGYRIGDNLMPIDLPVRGLYSKIYMSALVDAGYKFYDYAGKICDASGMFIVDLPSMDISEVDDGSWMSGVELAETAMTDAEASEFYTFDTAVPKVEFAKGNYTIHTRDELISYIEMVKQEMKMFGYVFDNRPLNYFVAPEARFTLEELSKGGMEAGYLKVLCDRRTFRDYGAYLDLISFLREQGVLNTDKPNQSELLQAYYAWGPEGINANCVGQRIKLAVDGHFNTVDDNRRVDKVKDLKNEEEKLSHLLNQQAANRTSKLPVLYDGNYNLRHLRYTANLRNIMDVLDFDRERFCVNNNDSLMKIKRRTTDGFNYVHDFCGALSDVSDRIYFTLRGENNYTYVYKASWDKVMLSLESGRQIQVYSAHNFRFATYAVNIYLNLNEVQTADDYLLWNMCLTHAASLQKANAVDVPIRDTYSMLMSAGMSPISALNYMVDRITAGDDSPYESNRTLASKYLGLKTTCVQIFRNPVPKEILDAFRLYEDEVEDIFEFVDKADIEDLHSRRNEMLQGNLLPGMTGYDYTFKIDDKERRRAMMTDTIPTDAVAYYNNVKFVVDAMSGFIAMDNLGDGLMSDREASYKTAATIMMNLIYAVKGDHPTIDEGADVILNAQLRRYFDIDHLFRVRDAAYKGYLVDYANIVDKVTNDDNIYWMYVNKVFKELSNKPEDLARPWLMEVICLSKYIKQDKLMMDLVTSLVESTLKGIEFEGKDEYVRRPVRGGFPPTEIEPGVTRGDLLMKFTRHIAAELFFKIIGIKLVDGQESYNVPFIIPGLNTSVNIIVPAQVVTIVKNWLKADISHIKYISIFDYNKMEYFEGGEGRFIYHMVNADVDMWNVKPRKGYKINMLPLGASYYRPTEINSIGGEGFKEGLITSGAAIGTNLIDICADESRIVCFNRDRNDKGMARADFVTVRDTQYSFMLDEYDSFGSADYVFAYIKKWALLNREAKADGLIVEHMPHKSDLFWSGLAPLLNLEIPSNVPTYKSGVNNSLINTSVKQVKWDPTTALELHSTGVRLSKAAIYDFSMSEFIKIYAELILNQKYVEVSTNYIRTPDGTTFLVTNMSNAERDILISNYGYKGENGVFFVTPSGFYIMRGL